MRRDSSPCQLWESIASMSETSSFCDEMKDLRSYRVQGAQAAGVWGAPLSTNEPKGL